MPSTPPPTPSADLVRDRLRARARRVALIRRRVVAAALATFAIAFGTIAASGSLGSTGATATTGSSTASTSSGSTASTSSGSTASSQQSSSSPESSASAVTTSQS